MRKTTYTYKMFGTYFNKGHHLTNACPSFIIFTKLLYNFTLIDFCPLYTAHPKMW